MNLLVTAGNTQVLIDKVRCITNIFTGRTGAGLALEAARRGHVVTLLTSHPDAVRELAGDIPLGVTIRAYRTFDELQTLMATLIPTGGFDAILHAAAVSDYRAGGIYAPTAGTSFDAETSRWTGAGAMADRSAGKVKSDEPELWLRLVRAPKLVDFIRKDWNFDGVLVKFKLEVGIDEERLLEIAERSRRQSAADWMVANTLEGAQEWALLGPYGDAGYRKVARRDLASELLDAVEQSVQCNERTLSVNEPRAPLSPLGRGVGGEGSPHVDKQ